MQLEIIMLSEIHQYHEINKFSFACGNYFTEYKNAIYVSKMDIFEIWLLLIALSTLLRNSGLST